jgi:hypothetical protein
VDVHHHGRSELPQSPDRLAHHDKGVEMESRAPSQAGTEGEQANSYIIDHEKVIQK